MRNGTERAGMPAMNDLSPTPLFLNENPVAVPMPKALERATLWLFASLGGVAATAILVFAVATQSGADAERIAGVQTGGVNAFVSSLAATHGRPGAL